jgi:nitroimidazol reductase NimA-like FMN-containing flavoprotein (pyridoxamine 5'-phosphate oxidase superfamily)
MVEPVADRPDLPAAYLGPAPLPWQWAVEQLTAARNYWVTSIGPSGRPHVRPVWGVWRDDTVQFSTGGRHGANLSRDPRVTVNLDDGDECVIVEGTSNAVADAAFRRAFCDAYAEKYDWPITIDVAQVVHVVQPKVVLGWLAHDIARESTLFQATATRWRFTP